MTKMVSIPEDEYQELLRRDRWLEALEMAGVDNWEGYDLAQEMLDDEELEDDSEED